MEGGDLTIKKSGIATKHVDLKLVLHDIFMGIYEENML